MYFEMYSLFDSKIYLGACVNIEKLLERDFTQVNTRQLSVKLSFCPN